MSNLRTYSKAIAAVLGAVAIAVTSAVTDNIITNPEWVMVAVAGVGAFEVFATKNTADPLWNKAKAITAGVSAGLVLIGGYIANDNAMTNAMWVNVAIAAIAAGFVYKVENDDSEDLNAPRG